MESISKVKTLALADESFNKQKYEQALRQYALVLRDFPDSKEAKNRAILAEMAMSGEVAAEALFDYYEILKEESRESADVVISEILETMDGTLDQIVSLFKDPMRIKLEHEDGILYDDFKLLVERDGDFKNVFENIMFSTKVLITDRDDFIDFLDLLSCNGFEQMLMNYIEPALALYPTDERLRKILASIKKN